jgi:hypothetical protein
MGYISGTRTLLSASFPHHTQLTQQYQANQTTPTSKPPTSKHAVLQALLRRCCHRQRRCSPSPSRRVGGSHFWYQVPAPRRQVEVRLDWRRRGREVHLQHHRSDCECPIPSLGSGVTVLVLALTCLYSERPDLCQHPQRQLRQRRPPLHPWPLKYSTRNRCDASQSLTVDSQSRGNACAEQDDEVFSFVSEWFCWQGWHATACRHTLASYVAREDDELMSSGQVVLPVVPDVIMKAIARSA